MEVPLSLSSLINQLNFNYKYALDLIEDVREDDMTNTPAKGLENHPAFTIGHIITAYGMTTKHLGGEYTVSKEWDELFRRRGPGDPRIPEKDKSLYPKKEALIRELSNQHDMLLKLLDGVSEEKLDKSIKWRYSNYFPKTIDLVYFMSITHYAMHISQLAAWRRAMGLPSSLARL